MQELSTGKALYTAYKQTWRNNRMHYDSYTSYGKNTCIDANTLDLSNYNTFEIPVATEIPEDAKLVFDKTSKYPRHKLQTTKFVRKIKESLADYIVGNYKKSPMVSIKRTHSLAFVSDKSIIFTNDDSVTIADIKASGSPFEHEDFTIVKNFSVLCLDNEEKLYIDYMEGKHTIPLVTDSLLNKLTDACSDVITPDDVNAIIQLIKTNDKDNIGLGAKLFCQFNLSATPAFAHIFLMYYHGYMQWTPAGSSVVYKNLISQFRPMYKSDYNIAKILETFPPNEQERELIKMIILDEIVRDVEYKINNYNKTIKGLGIKFEYKLTDE